MIFSDDALQMPIFVAPLAGMADQHGECHG